MLRTCCYIGQLHNGCYYHTFWDLGVSTNLGVGDATIIVRAFLDFAEPMSLSAMHSYSPTSSSLKSRITRLPSSLVTYRPFGSSPIVCPEFRIHLTTGRGSPSTRQTNCTVSPNFASTSVGPSAITGWPESWKMNGQVLILKFHVSRWNVTRNSSLTSILWFCLINPKLEGNHKCKILKWYYEFKKKCSWSL